MRAYQGFLNFLEGGCMEEGLRRVLCMLVRFPVFFRKEKCPYGAKPNIFCPHEDKDCRFQDVWYI